MLRESCFRVDCYADHVQEANSTFAAIRPHVLLLQGIAHAANQRWLSRVDKVSISHPHSILGQSHAIFKMPVWVQGALFLVVVTTNAA